MTKAQYPEFSAKILLFGEYSLMAGSKAFSMPLPQFKGRLKFATTENLRGTEIESNHNLKMFTEALQKMTNKGRLPVSFDFNRLYHDLDNGLFFDSTIPQGYGLGSSGALVAAIFHSYASTTKQRNNVLSQNEIKLLKNNFSIMESYFHGKSSGLDPLICYLTKPMIVNGDGTLQAVKILPSKPKGTKVLFLLDTGLTGKTQPLVNYFIRRCENKSYLDEITGKLLPLNDQSIHAFLTGDAESFKGLMQAISIFTLNNFSPMIPTQIKGLWKQGLKSNNFFLKLCGSGGGGMMLGYSDNFDSVQKQITEFDIQPVFRF